MNITYTSTLPETIMDWVQETAKQFKTTKKSIILEALTLYQTELKKKKMAAGFKRASQDKDILVLTQSHDFNF
jgi:hypothetical protein